MRGWGRAVLAGWLLAVPVAAVAAKAVPVHVTPPGSDTRVEPGGELSRGDVELFLKVYPTLVDQIIEKNSQSKAALPHPSETKKLLAKWPASGRYLQRYGLTPESWRELSDRLIRIWSWYWQFNDLKQQIDALEQDLRARTDTSPASELRRREQRDQGEPDGMVRVRLQYLAAQYKALAVQPDRPAQADIDLLAGFEAPVMEALLEAERHVSEANRGRIK